MSDTTADIDRHVLAITERLLDDIASVAGGFGQSGLSAADVAAHQLLWARYMTTGTLGFGEAVLHSLQALCRSAHVDSADGGAHCSDERRGLHCEKDLSDNARLLELLTWVWRVERCPELRACAEGIVGWALAELRVPGLGFAENFGAGACGRVVRADANGLMLVALIEAGSVFERRDWLALARDVFDELVATLADAGARSRMGRPDDDAMMSRAATRLFEAFGKQHHLDLAESWAAAADAVRCGARDMTDRGVSLSDAVMIGVLARLHALTGVARYGEQAEKLAEALQPALARSGLAGAAAVANMQTAAQLVSIQVTGDPRLPDTRELMRIALDHGLPDRLVLGPGAGGILGERPFVHVCIGAQRLAAIDDAARLRTMLAPGGLAAAFIRLEARETVDSRRVRSLI